jgi:tetratricopeptide (TPR) repeat protein
MRRWSLLAAIAGAIVLTWWMGCSNPNMAGGKLHFDQASRLEGADRTARFRRALETFQKASTELPQDAEVQLWIGKTYAELDRPDSAGMAFDRAEKLAPSMKADIQLVRQHYYSFKYNSGMTSAAAAMKARKQGSEAEAKAGFRDALDQFNKALMYNPQDAKTYTNIGKIYLNLSQVDSAIAMMQTARSIAPDDPTIKKSLFSVYRAEADTAYQNASMKLDAGDSTQSKTYFEQATKLYLKADEINPGQPDVNFQLGMTFYELSQLDRAGGKGYLDQAIGRYQAVLKDNPADVDVLYNLAMVLRDLDRNAEAKDYATRLVDLKPREGSYRQVLGRIEDKLGNKQALLNGIVFGTALKSGMKVDSVDARKRMAESSEMLKRRSENGVPDEILTFTDSQGQAYDVWFYWTRGQGVGFLQGKERFSSTFAPDGVLSIADMSLTSRDGSKMITGKIQNSSGRKYGYVRVEFGLYDENQQEITQVNGSTQNLDPHGTWSFEIPLEPDVAAKAVTVTPGDVLGY